MINSPAVYAIEQAYAFEAKSIPDFVAGFVYGMVGDNHLTEVEACYDGSTDIISEVERALKMIEKGNYKIGVAELGLVVKQFPAALTTCKGMGDDIAAIESWATIFTQPEELAETVGKNWLLHRSTIKGYLAEEESDWATGEYFSAGVDTAMALTEAVGPIQTTNEANMDLKMIPEFLMALYIELEGEIDEDAISQCIVSGTDLSTHIIDTINHIQSGNIFKAMMDIQKVILNMQKDLIPCEGIITDWSTIEQWVSVFSRPSELGETSTYNYLTNKSLIQDTLASEKASWAVANYKQAGIDFADLAIILLGPLAIPEPTFKEDMNLDPHMVNYLLAGFIYGMTEQNHLTEIEACYAGGSEMEKEIVTAIGDFKKGGWNNITQGVLEVLLAGF